MKKIARPLVKENDIKPSDLSTVQLHAVNIFKDVLIKDFLAGVEYENNEDRENNYKNQGAVDQGFTNQCYGVAAACGCSFDEAYAVACFCYKNNWFCGK